MSGRKMRITIFIILAEILHYVARLYRFLSAITIKPALLLLTPNEPKAKLPPITNDILLLSATDLSEKIRTKQLTATSIMRAYIERVKEINPLINAVVEDRFDSAIKDAERVDQFIADGELTVDELKVRFPFLGVPVSVKESIAVKGLSNSAGLKHSRKKAEEDAEVIRLLKDAGGIPFVVSNTPELCLNYESYNYASGRTLNPYDTSRTPGGSSGGEAALLASACSVIGVGSDVGGSLRLPAHFCGIWGHKPTPGLVSFQGHFPECSDKKNWRRIFTLGPMSRYATDLPLVLRVMSNSPEQNGKKVDFSKLKIFYLEDNGRISRPANSDITFAIRKTVAHFKNEHKAQVQKVNPKRLNYISMFALMDMLSIKGADDIFDKDPQRSACAELVRFFLRRSDYCFLSIMIVLLQRIVHPLGFDVRSARPKELINQLRGKLGNDGVLILPTFPEPAHKHYEIFVHIADVFYMLVFNYLGLPVTNCPVGFGKNGLPIGIQVVANRNCDRLTLAVAEEIEKIFGGWLPPERVC